MTQYQLIYDELQKFNNYFKNGGEPFQMFFNFGGFWYDWGVLQYKNNKTNEPIIGLYQPPMCTQPLGQLFTPEEMINKIIKERGVFKILKQFKKQHKKCEKRLRKIKKKNGE